MHFSMHEEYQESGLGRCDDTSSPPTALTTGGEVYAVLAPPSQALLVEALCVCPFWPHALGSYVLPYPVS